MPCHINISILLWSDYAAQLVKNWDQDNFLHLQFLSWPQAPGFRCNLTEAKPASGSAKYICFQSSRDNREQCSMTHSWTWSGQCLGNSARLLCSFSAASSVETKPHRDQQLSVRLFHCHKTVTLLTCNWKSSFFPVFILPLQVSVSDSPMLRMHIKWIMSFCLSSLQETTD